MAAAAGDWTRKGTLTVPFHTNPPSDICDRAGSSTLSARTHVPCRAGSMGPAAECALIPAGRCGHRPLRKDRRVHPQIGRRGRRPAVERSGTNALGVRRPVSAAVPRCEAPSGRGLSAQPTGGERTVWNLSLRQRFALPPPSQREARRDGFLCAAGHMGPALRPPICATVQVLCQTEMPAPKGAGIVIHSTLLRKS